MNHLRFEEFCAKINRYIILHDKEHGPWLNKTNKEKVEHIYNEFEELEDAAERKDVNGEHGMKIEALHVACTAYKLWRSL